MNLISNNKQSHNELPKFNNLGINNQLKSVECPDTSCQDFPDLSVTVYDRTCALMRGIDLILTHHGCPSELRADCVQQLHDHLDTSKGEDVWVKRTKYVLAYPLAQYLKQSDKPKSADIPFTWRTGRFSRWFGKRLREHSRPNTHLFYSWFQAKRACLPCSEEHIEETYKDHLSRLTANDSGDVHVIDSIFRDRTFQYVLKKIERSVRESYEQSQFDLSPSTSSCFTHQRSENGQYGYIRSYLGYDFITDAFDTELVSMGFAACGYNSGIRQYNVVYENRRYNSHGRTIDVQRCLDLNALKIVNKPNLSCCIQAVIEPLKVRVISKGEALPYYLSHPIQKGLHSAMRHMDCFRLIGQPFSATMLYDLAEKSESYFKWLSIDYSAATDGLSWQYTKQILGYLISGLPASERRIAMAVLGPHDLYYPSDGGIEYRGRQRNGQLMGSILSFPILCLANLGVYLKNTQAFQEDWSHEERLRHVLVNGDDMLYAAPANYFDTHKSISKCVGLEMSPGKAYVHKSYVNINSVSVHYDLSLINRKMRYNSLYGNQNQLYGKNQPSPWRIDFLNTGLFFGNHKVMGGSDDKFYFKHKNGIMVSGRVGDLKYDELLPNLNAVLAGSRPGKQYDLLKMYLHIHKDQLRMDMTFDVFGHSYVRNLFLPIELGGYGIDPPVGWRYKITKCQKRVALAMIAKADGKIASSHSPLRGFPLIKKDDLIRVPYRITESKVLERTELVLIYSKLLHSKLDSNRYFPLGTTKYKFQLKAHKLGFSTYSSSEYRISMKDRYRDPNLASLLYSLNTFRDLVDEVEVC
jgi:hypothetical protein